MSGMSSQQKSHTDVDSENVQIYCENVSSLIRSTGASMLL